MRRTISVLIVCGAAAGLVAAIARPSVDSGPNPSLHILAAKPLTVAGRNFRPHERVRVTAKITVTGERRTTAVAAGGTGRFRVEFGQLGVSRCAELRIVAVRRSGRAVVVKHLPAPACLPA